MGYEKNIETIVCPEGHRIPKMRQNLSQIPVGKDANLNNNYKLGLFCHQCDISYSINNLKKPEDI
jgi:hypothetical protein